MTSASAFTVVGDSAQRDFWLKQRALGIGASEAWKLWDEPYSLWAIKCGVAPEEDLSDNERVLWGKRLEHAILSGWADDQKMPVRHNTHLLRSTKWEWMSCTPDGFVLSDSAFSTDLPPVEAKNVGLDQAGGWSDNDTPRKHILQAQQQMAVTGESIGYLVALIGGNRLVWRRVERDDKMISEIVERGAEMMQRIATGSPPEVDGSDATAAALAAQFSKDDGTSLHLGAESSEVVRQLARAKAEAKELDATITLYENRIKATLGERTTGLLDDGKGRVSWKLQQRAAYSVEASEHRVMRVKL